jgi:uncharacterized surface protein with fasciclin (FAS1) repeats
MMRTPALTTALLTLLLSVSAVPQPTDSSRRNLRGGRHGSKTSVYKIENGQCGESKVSKFMVRFAVRMTPGLQQGTCASVGYTLKVGTKNVKSGNKFVGTIQTTLYTKPGENLCTSSQVAPLNAACSRFAGDMADVSKVLASGACASPCLAAVKALRSQKCTIPGEGNIDMELIAKSCAGKHRVDGHETMMVGAGSKCALNFCESGNCPRCDSGLKCLAPPGVGACAGTCFGTCVAVKKTCSTCAELGWPVGRGDRSVCAESDKGFSCTTNAVFSKAERTCKMAGARLCTATELLTGEGMGSGCGHDGRYIWSSSRTGAGQRCKVDERVIVSGRASRQAGVQRGDARCAKLTSRKTALRCCADTTCKSGGATKPPSSLDSGSVAGLLASQPQYSTLVAAVKAAGLLSFLDSSKGPLTVLAPNNGAFAALDAAKPGTVASLLANRAKLSKILQYHVVQGNIESFELTTGQKIQTLEKEVVRVTGSGEHINTLRLNDKTRVVEPDLAATNGVVHGIDHVLIPPSIAGATTTTVYIINKKGQCGQSTFLSAWRKAALRWLASQRLTARVGTCKAHGYTVGAGSQTLSKTGAPSSPVVQLFTKPVTNTLTVRVFNEKGQCGESTFPAAWKTAALAWVASQDLEAEVGSCAAVGYTKPAGAQALHGTGAPSTPLVKLFVRGGGH